MKYHTPITYLKLSYEGINKRLLRLFIKQDKYENSLSNIKHPKNEKSKPNVKFNIKFMSQTVSALINLN